MKPATTLSNNVARALVAIVLVGVPFHGFATVWGSALVGHYTLLRAWDNVLLIVLAGTCAWWLVGDTKLRTWVTESLLVRLIAAYVGLAVLMGVISYLRGDVSPKALAYGLSNDVRFVVWFLAVLITARRTGWPGVRWQKILLIPAGIVVVFAVMQYTVLPHDFLTHFGYHADTTIAPIETINHNSRYIRVQSTLRGANPLGAYLVIILSAAGLLLIRTRRWIYGVFGLLALGALYASGSRSAWIGATLGLFVAAWLLLKSQRGRVIVSVVSLAVLAVGASGYLVLRHNTHLQNAVLHTQDNSTIATSSNDAHVSAVVEGLRGAAQQPLGDGPGTAGPASVYNTKQPARIAENYYVQIAQETGWLGLALFVAIVVLVGIELYSRAGSSPLALVLFAALVGVSFVNMLSHAWTDDTLAFLWWGFAGVALAQAPQAKTKQGRAHAT